MLHQGSVGEKDIQEAETEKEHQHQLLYPRQLQASNFVDRQSDDGDIGDDGECGC